MKINNFYNSKNTYQQKPLEKQSFKGYFACPIKELHFQTFNSANRRYPVIRDLQRKCGKYFDIIVQTADGFSPAKKFKKPPQKEVRKSAYPGEYCEYGQDNKLFIENKILLLQGCMDAGWKEAKILAEHLGIKSQSVRSNVQGGNCFLGKLPTGENFALIGQDALCIRRDSTPWSGGDVIKTVTKQEVAKEMGIKPENLYVIPQPDFHLDMAIRPLKYPYVLVDDMDLTFSMAKTDKQRDYLKNEVYLLSQKEMIAEKKYATPKQTAEELEKHGFKPIMVPGSFGFYRTVLNYMNAIVHQNPDGSLTYITNRSERGKKFWLGLNMEKIFTEYLKTQCPDVKDVIFIDWQTMGRESAGIHCLTSERPDFERWKNMS